MSLFDVLRYPISNAPTRHELKSLPNDLFVQWRHQTIWEQGNNHKTPEGIGEWYEACRHTLEDSDADAIKLLRKMILEYNEPV